MKPVTSKVAIVTGASSGIGKETACLLLACGYHVHAGARRVEAMADLKALGASVHYLDLTDSAGTEAFVAAVLAETPRIDALVNNAGYGTYGAIEDVAPADTRAQMDVNLFGLARLIQLTLPTMRAQRSGRIVNVTSIGGKIWSPLGGWYHASKFAVEGLSDCLRNEVRPFGIDVIVVRPGSTKTEWTGIALDAMRAASGSGPYRPIVAGASAAFGIEFAKATPQEVAAAIVHALVVRRPKSRYAVPFAAKAIVGIRRMLNDGPFDWLFDRLFRIPRRLPLAGVAGAAAARGETAAATRDQTPAA
jgi:NAD(P)-dependent dehydrogenase (short-subunit alcohol dehydrogenase family)